MLKGIKLKNSNLPRFLTDEPKPYKLTILDSVSMPSQQKKTVKARLDILDQNFTEIVQEFPVGTSFLYHNTVILSPLEKSELRDIETSGLPVASFYDQFNYNSMPYIDYTENNDELDLPNFYLSKATSDNEEYTSLFSLNASISSRDIFKNSAKLANLSNIRTPSQREHLKNIFLSKNAERYSNIEKNNFPFAVDIKFNFKDIDIMSEILDVTSLHESTIHNIEKLPKTGVAFDVVRTQFSSEESFGATIQVSSVEDLINYAYYPTDGFLVHLPNLQKRFRFDDNLNKLQLNREFNSRSLNLLPNLLNMTMGSIVENEILYLKIEKHLGDVVTGRPIQNFWIRDASQVNLDDPSKSKYGIYDYYDTQVKSGATYTYIIKAFVIVYGCEVTCENYDSVTKELDFTMKPSYKVVDVEVMRKTITVQQPVQLPPYVMPYNNIKNNKAKFYLQLQQGRTFMDYITFRQEDDIYEQVVNSSPEDLPEHAFTEEPATFEVYRLEQRPLKLFDFSNAKIADISRTSHSTTAVYSENLAYNKDYYYLFRAINTQGYPSNPTSVYRVRIEKGIERNKMHVQTFDFTPPEQQYDREKNFTRLIHIMPNIRDTFIDEESTAQLDTYENNIGEVKMGLNEEFAVWGKRYKIRIKSNNTGKKIDLNLNFKLTRKE